MKALFFAALSLVPAPEIRTFVLKDLGEVRAEVLRIDGDRVQLRVQVEGGTAEATRPLSDFAPQSAFIIMRSETPPDDMAGHLKLAEFAIHNGLVDAGLRELRKARDLAVGKGIDPSHEARLVARGLAVLEEIFRQLVAGGRLQDARVLLTQILSNPKSLLSDAQKQELVNLVEEAEGKKREETARAKEARADAEASARREQQLDPMRRSLDRAKSMQHQALLDSHRASQAINEFGAASQAFASVRREGEQLLKRSPGDATLADEVKAMTEEARQNEASSLLSQASIYVVRGNFNSAMGSVNRVLADDPENSQALAMRARIELAANEGDSVGAGVVGGFGRVR
jgi:hypothetical protein